MSRRLSLLAALLLLGLLTACSGEGGAAGEPPSAGAIASCSADADCAIFDDGDPCTGVWSCADGTCALGAAVVCDPKGDTICAANTCDPTTGACAQTPRNDGAACQDGDPCTVGDACEAGACKAGPANQCACQTTADCKKAEDGDLCNGTLICDTAVFPHRCVVNPATVVTCPDGGGCKEAACDPKTGDCSATPKPDGTTCDDGEACTKGDACKAGACAPGANVCTCKTDEDCGAQEDGDLCNGTLYCVQAGDKAGTCQVNPASVVTCPTVDDTTCSKRQCQPATGLCVKTAVGQGKACDDGDSCTEGEVCQGGLCTGGKDVCKCSADADCKKAEDGNACNGTLFCNKQSGECQVNPATVITCPSGGDTDCSKNACKPADGSCAKTAVEQLKQVCATKVGVDGPEPDCRYELLPAGAPTAKLTLCDDGDPCTASDSCKGGSCQAGTQVCTCKTDADCAKVDDGDLCNGVPYCDKGTGTCKPNPSSKVVCPTVDDTACLKRTCEPKTGQCPLKPLANGTLCDDGNSCTKGDTCVFGQCNAGANTCECQTNADCLKKDDGDLCNGVPYCDKSDPKAPKCKDNPASKVFCAPSSSDCAVNACNPANGLCQPKPAAEGKACDDGTVCTKDSTCQGGACVAKTKLDCDDDDACTLDGCDPKTGCTHIKANCADGNSCTTDACDAKTGKCSFPAKGDGVGCDADGSGCTVGDSCKAGVCKAGPQIPCTLPTKACEQAVCLSKGANAYQCVVAAKEDGAACDDGDACSLTSACSKGQCVAKAGSEGLFAKSYSPSALQNGVFATLMPLDDGGYLLGGRYWGNGVSDGTWVVRVSADGTQLWQRKQTAKDGKGSGGVVGLLPVSNVAAAVLRTQVVGKLTVGAIDLISLSGKSTVITAQVPSQSGSLAFAGGATLPDGSMLIGGTVTPLTGQPRPWAGRVTSTGQPLWGGDLGVTLKATVNGVGAPLGALVLVGQDNKKHAWAGQVGPDGKPHWQVSLPGKEGDELHAVARAPGGGLVLVGTSQAKTKPRGFTVALSETGVLRWTQVAPNPSETLGVAALGDAALRIVGRTVVGASTTDALLVGVDPLGNPRFNRGQTGGPIGAGHAVVGLPDHSVAIAGQRTDATTGKRVGLLWRVGAFGHESCSKQGKCAGKKVSDCDDGKPCTADHCKAVEGCVAVPSPGFACDPGDGCHLDGICVSNACKPGERTLLYTRTTSQTKDTQGWTGAVATPGGGWLVFGQRKDFDPVVERLDATGTVLWSTAWDDISKYLVALPTTVSKALPTADGGALLALTRYPLGTNKALPGLRRIDASGTELWSFNTNPKSAKLSGDPTDLDAIPGSTDVVWLLSQAGSMTVVRVADQGKQVWQALVDFSNQYKVTVAEGTRPSVLAHSDGGAFVGATMQPKYHTGWPWIPFVRRLNALGKTVWSQQYKRLGAIKLTRLVRRKDGAALAVGWIPRPGTGTQFQSAPHNGWRLWLMRFDDKGNALWQREERSAVMPHSVAALPDGGLALLGTTLTEAKTEAMLLTRVGLGGGVQWERQYAPAGLSARAGVGMGVASDAAGNLLLAGAAVVTSKSTKPLLMRLDPLGRATCAEAGGCGKTLADTKNKGCADTNPCTLDGCDPKTGQCTHTPAPDGLACGDAKVCVAGACTAEPPGFVLIPKGSFVMGCNITADPSCAADEKPNRTIALPSFWMQRGEVSFAAYKACADAGKCGKANYYTEQTKHVAATHVPWAHAKLYCTYVGGRLPTEAEWAYAAKGSCALIDGDCAKGMPVSYGFSGQAACAFGKANSDWATAYGCGGTANRETGQASGDRSPFGVLDMLGNLAEYVGDYYSEKAYNFPYKSLPNGPTSGSLRVVRGGTWLNDKADDVLRLSRRRKAGTSGAAVYGFRCVIPIK